MKLYEYAIELANAIMGTEQNKSHQITITLLPDHLAHRHIIGRTIYNQFVNNAARDLVSNTFDELDAVRKELDAARAQISQMTVSIQALEALPKKKTKKIVEPKQEFPVNEDPAAELQNE